MSPKGALFALALATTASVGNADCLLAKSLEDPGTDNLCAFQGAGDWTFSMYTSEVDIPTGSSGGISGGYGHSHSFYIFDEGCNLKGKYDISSSDCGIPYVIKDSFLPWVLTVKSVDYDTGDPSFTFAYGDGDYSTHGKCAVEDTGSPEAARSCKSAFPLNGHFDG